MTDIQEAQTYQNIGEIDPAFSRVPQAGDAVRGWDTDVPEPPISQREGHDWSNWNRRGNNHALGKTGDDLNFAADMYGDGDADGIPSWQNDFPWGGPSSAAAAIPTPFQQGPDPGVIDGADAASERSATNQAGSPPYP